MALPFAPLLSSRATSHIRYNEILIHTEREKKQSQMAELKQKTGKVVTENGGRAKKKKSAVAFMEQKVQPPTCGSMTFSRGPLRTDTFVQKCRTEYWIFHKLFSPPVYSNLALTWVSSRGFAVEVQWIRERPAEKPHRAQKRQNGEVTSPCSGVMISSRFRRWNVSCNCSDCTSWNLRGEKGTKMVFYIKQNKSNHSAHVLLKEMTFRKIQV